MPRHLTNWLKGYLDYTKTSESPLTFHFWTGISTISGALGRKVWQEQYIFQWIPNFYIILVAPAGIASKSTTLNFGMGLLERVGTVHFGPESGSWQGLGDALAESVEYFKWKDSTGVEHSDVQSAVTVAASELGTFLRPDDEHAVSFLTDAWDGRKRTFKHKTKHSGNIDIERPCLNLIGATTPSWIQRNIPENLIRDGLLSRVVFVYGDSKRHLSALPSRSIHGPDFVELGRKLVEDLKEIADLRGRMLFEREIEREGGWMDTWYAQHHSGRAVHMASDRFGGYLARKQTHLVKLAMVLSISRRSDLIITMEDITEADTLLTATEQSMIKVYESMGVVDEARHVAEVISFVRAYGWLDSQALHNLCHNIMREADYKQALRLGIEGGALQVVVKNGVRGLSIKAYTKH